MVFCGKPSKGCQVCRERKIRCDQLPQGCTQCAIAKRDCPGYRDQLELMFRNESDKVVRKAKAKEAKAKREPLKPPTQPSPVKSPAEKIHSGSQSLFKVARQQDHCFPMFLPPALAPTIEERAIEFFFTNYVIGVHGPTRGHLDRLADIYNTHKMNENLLASMKAVGLAGFSLVACAPGLMRDARQQYTKALRLTNAALGSPTDVKEDSTLLAIMILSIFETVTGCNQRSLKAWAEHVNGAAALVKLRGFDQLRSPGGRGLFAQVTTSLLISCIQRQLAVPAHILELRAEAAKFIDTSETAWLVQEFMIAFADFRASIRKGTLSDPQIILSRALELDSFCQSLFSNVPSDWEYETLFTDADPDIVFNGCYHVYYDFWVAQLWNGMRTTRILLNLQIRNILLEGFSSKNPLFLGQEHIAQFQISRDVLFQLQADILASVPQHVGYVSKHRSSSSSSGPTVPPSGGQSDARFPCTDFRQSAFPTGSYDQASSETPLIRASGGYFLLWPLFLAGNMDIATESVRLWVIQNLQSFGRSMGIQQAFVLAKVLETKEEIKVWHEKQKPDVAIPTLPASA